MEVNRWDENEDGPLDEVQLKQKLESLGYRVSTYTYPPGMYFDFHTHPIDKIDAVLSGQFRITMDGESKVLKRGDWVYVPAEKPHSAEVIGHEPVKSLDGEKK